MLFTRPTMPRVNLIYKASISRITGLSRDAQIIEDLLVDHCQVNHYRITDRLLLKRLGIPSSLRSRLQTAIKSWRYPFDVNIFLEKIRPELVPLARYNVLIPNQEMFAQVNAQQLSHIDRVFCKTQYATEIFQKLSTPTDLIDFTSDDRLISAIDPDYREFFHLAGKSSPRRGTKEILELWKRNPKFPRLTVVAQKLDARPYEDCRNIRLITRYLPDRAIQRLQNEIGIHICLSQAEGFGHFIVEAMSSRGLVITTDAPPMNDLVQPDRGCLIPLQRSEQVEGYFHELFFFDPIALEKAVQELIAMPLAEKRAKGTAARRWYNANHTQFQQNLRSVVTALVNI
jgi:hypothetical protein